jgi:HEAT repeat protein
LVGALADGSRPVRRAAEEALEKIDAAWASCPVIQGVVDGIAQGLKFGLEHERGQAASDALVLVGPAAVASLEKGLHAADDRVLREAAATTLGRIGPRARTAMPALVRAAQDPHGFVREAAVQAIRLIDPTARE